LIVIEGTDGVGRSTQIALLREWLEGQGYAVVSSGLRRSELAGPGLEQAKQGNTLDHLTLNLYYATDFCDRQERQIIPSLRAGMIALVDRYVFSLIVRAAVRGVPRQWMEDVCEFALVPDKVIYLDIDVPHLIPRVLIRSGFDFWEAGEDFLSRPSLFDNFVQYQTMVLEEFRRMAERHDFTVIDASRGMTEVYADLVAEVQAVIQDL
jgi:dTMP kinase